MMHTWPSAACLPVTILTPQVIFFVHPLSLFGSCCISAQYMLSVQHLVQRVINQTWVGMGTGYAGVGVMHD